MKSALIAAILAASAVSGSVSAAQPREQIRIVGSSTVFPYTQAVAEEFASLPGRAAPVVEATGTGGGMKVFCGGLGPKFADVTGASRPITRTELQDCAAHGVDSVTELLLGFDGLTIAHSVAGPDMDLSKRTLFQALASEVEVDGRIAPNPYTTWAEIDPALPEAPIRVFGPPPTSGTRDAFVEMVMKEGCSGFPAIAALDPERKAEVCSRMRQDGPFIEAGENDNIIVQRLVADPEALGVFGYTFLFENTDRLKAAAVDGVTPDAETIANGAYHVSRPLYIYIKNAHRGVIPGLDAFVSEYVSEDAFGPDGYLADRGLIALPPAEREAARAAVAAGRHLDRFREGG